MKRFRNTLFVISVSIVHGHAWKPKPLADKGIYSSKTIERISNHEYNSDFENSCKESVNAIGRGGGNDNKKEDSKSTMAASVFNLVNNVAGAGILTLSAGMAAGTGWIPAIAICAGLGTIGSHCFAIIGEACEMTGESDFKVIYHEIFAQARLIFSLCAKHFLHCHHRVSGDALSVKIQSM